jgi:hypothetical protein
LSAASLYKSKGIDTMAFTLVVFCHHQPPNVNTIWVFVSFQLLAGLAKVNKGDEPDRRVLNPNAIDLTTLFKKRLRDRDRIRGY